MIWALLFVGICILLTFEGDWIGSGIPGISSPRQVNQWVNRALLALAVIFLIFAVIETT